jgi:NADPH:quinone reductase
VNCANVARRRAARPGAGGAGAVGHFAIGLARHAGARVIATVSTPEKAELAVKAGAHHVVNYRDADAIDHVRELVDRVDRIVEVDLEANLALDLAVSGPETVIATYASTGHDPTLPVRACMGANVTLRFVSLYGVPLPAQEQAATDVTAALAADARSPLPAHRFALDDIVAAHEAAEKGVTSKILVDVP